MYGSLIRLVFLAVSIGFNFWGYAAGTSLISPLEGQRLFARDVDSMRLKLGKEKSFSAELVVTNRNVSGFMHSINATIHRKGDFVYYKLLNLEYLFLLFRIFSSISLITSIIF